MAVTGEENIRASSLLDQLNEIDLQLAAVRYTPSWFQRVSNLGVAAVCGLSLSQMGAGVFWVTLVTLAILFGPELVVRSLQSKGIRKLDRERSRLLLLYDRIDHAAESATSLE